MKRLTGTLKRKGTKGKDELRASAASMGGAPEAKAPKPAPVMPEKQELERVYKQLLEDLAIPEAKRENMIKTEDDGRKWKLIQHHSAMVRLTSDTSKETQQPKYWVNIIQGRNIRNEPSMTIEQAGELQAVIRTSHKQFLKKFVDLMGIQHLIDLTHWYASRSPRTSEEKEILPQVMTCFKALMNNQLGMDAVLGLEDSITTIAMAMDLNDVVDIRTTQEVVMLLAVTCFYSSLGRNLVVKAMDDLRIRYREAARFESLVKLFEECNDNEFRASVIMFITTIVNSAASVDSRVRVRNDFLALDIMRVFERAVAEATDEDQACAVIATQFQVFEDMMVADHSEVIHSMYSTQKDDASSVSSFESDENAVDLSDQGAVIELVRGNALKSGCPELLLEVFQTLLLIPPERTLAVPIWNAITQFIREATNFDTGTTKARSIKLNYSILHDLLDKRLSLDRNFSQLTSSDDIIIKQRDRIHELEKMVNGKGGSATGSGEEVTILKAQITKQEKEIVFLKKKVHEVKKSAKKSKSKKGASGGADGTASDDSASNGMIIPDDDDVVIDSTGLAPAGPAPGKNGGPPPPVPKPGMAGSLDQAPVKVTKALLEKLKKMDKERTKGGAAAPPKNPFAGIAAAAAKKKGGANKGGAGDAGDAKGNAPGKFDGLMSMISARSATGGPGDKGVVGKNGLVVDSAAAKKQKELAKKFPEKKAIYPNVKMRSIFWTKVQTSQLENTVWAHISDKSTKIEVKQLEAQFGKDVMESKLKKANTMERKAKQEVHLCDSKRQQNIGIAISRFRISDTDLRDAILEMDETLLTAERSKALMLLAPTPEELELIHNFEESNGNLKKLCREDRFLREMSAIPRMQQRMKCIVTKHTLEQDVEIMKQKMAIIRDACKEVEKSKELRKLLEVVLAVGNYTNGGTPRGQAYGFKMEALTKLETVKSNGAKHSLLHFLVQLFEKHYPDVLNIRLPASQKAAEFSLSDLQQELNATTSAVKDVKTELEEEHPLKKDRFVKSMSGFEVRASKRIQELRTEFDSIRQEFQRVALYFSEKGPKVEPMTFFSRFVRFQQSMLNAKRQIDQQRIRMQRQKMLEEEKKKRATLKKMREMQEQGGGVFEAFAKANAGNASDIVEGFLQRYRKNSYANLRKQQNGGDTAPPQNQQTSEPSNAGGEGELMAILARRKIKSSKKKKKKKKGASTKKNADFAIA